MDSLTQIVLGAAKVITWFALNPDNLPSLEIPTGMSSDILNADDPLASAILLANASDSGNL